MLSLLFCFAATVDVVAAVVVLVAAAAVFLPLAIANCANVVLKMLLDNFCQSYRC